MTSCLAGFPLLSLQPGPLSVAAGLSPGACLAPGVTCLCGTPLQFGTYSESEKKTEEYDTQVSGVLLAVATRGEGPSWVWGLPHLSRDPGKLPAGFLTQEGALGAPRPQSCGPLRHVLSCWEMSSSPWGCGAVSQVPSATWGYPPPHVVFGFPLPRGFRVGSHIPCAGILCSGFTGIGCIPVFTGFR